MTATPALGDLIRESRLALGYSLGQLATKVGRTAATVRTWERGEAVPNEESRAALESVLDIDPGELEKLVPSLNSKAEDAQDDFSVEPEEEPSTADEGGVDGADEAEVVAPADTDEESDEEAAGPEADTPQRPEDDVADVDDDEDPEQDQEGARAVAGGLAAVAVAADDVEPVHGDEALDEGEAAGESEDVAAEPDAAEPDGSDDADTELPLVPLVTDGLPLDDEEIASDQADGAADDDQSHDTLEGIAAVTPFEVDPGLIDEPTEAVVVPVVAAATGVATQTRSVVKVSEPKEQRSRNPLRAFFDPSNRWLYWLRALLTIVVAVVLLLVAVWAAGELFDALGEVLDSIEPTEVDDGEIDALGRLRRLI